MKEKVRINPTTVHCGITFQEQPEGRIVFAAKIISLQSKFYTLCVTSDGFVVSLDGKNNETKAAFKVPYFLFVFVFLTLGTRASKRKEKEERKGKTSTGRASF